MKTHLNFDGFIQIGIVVKDIEKAVKTWCDLFNIPVPEIKIQEPGPNRNIVSYRGKPASYGRKIAGIKVPSRGFIIELLEPIGGESSFQEFMDKHGQGVHHLGFAAGDKKDTIIGELEEIGCAIRTVGVSSNINSDNSWAFMDTEDVLGVNLNIKNRGGA